MDDIRISINEEMTYDDKLVQRKKMLKEMAVDIINDKAAYVCELSSNVGQYDKDITWTIRMRKEYSKEDE